MRRASTHWRTGGTAIVIGPIEPRLRKAAAADALKASACRHTTRFNSECSMRLRKTCKETEIPAADALVFRPRQMIHSVVCGRAWPGHPRLAGHASPLSVDARHKAGHERLERD